VNYPEQLRMGAFYANEFLDFHIKDRIVWLNPFEPQFAVAVLAAHGRRGLGEVAHMPLPFVRHAS